MYCIVLVKPSSYCYDSWSKKFNIFEKEKVFVPINYAWHWTLLVMYIQEKRIQYYDSCNLSGSGARYLNAALQYLGDEAEKLNIDGFDASEWTLIPNIHGTPQQDNGFDCGVFVVMFADHITDDLPLAISQTNMPFFRNKICADVLRGTLKYSFYIDSDVV